MVKTLILPIIKKYWKLLLSTLIVTALGSAIMMGLSSAHLSLKNTLDKYILEYSYPDAELTTEVTTKEKLEKLSQIKGVKEVNYRLVADTMMISPSGKYLSVRAFSYDDADFQKFYVWSEKDNTDYDEVLVEYNFADENGISAGDIVKFKIGDEYREYFVSKIVSSPETLAMQPTENSWGANSDFGYVYASRELLEKETKKEKESAEEELESKNDELSTTEDDAKIKHDELQSEIESAENELASKKKELEKSKNEAQSNLKELRNGKTELQNKKIELQNTRKELVNARADLISKKEQAISAKETLPSTIKELKDTKSKLVEAKNALNEIDSAIAELNNEYQKLTSSQATRFLSLLKSFPDDFSISEVYEISNIAQEIFRLDEYKEFINLLSEYSNENNITTVGEFRRAYNQLLKDIPQKRRELKSTRQEIVTELSKQGVKEDEIDSKIKEIDDGIKEAEDTLNTINTSIPQIDSGIAEIDNNIKQIDDGFKEIDKNISEIEKNTSKIESAMESGESQINAAENELDEKKEELSTAWVDSMKQFTDAKDELKKAFEELGEKEGYENFFNQILLKFDEGEDRANILERVQESLEDVNIKDSFTYEDSSVKNRIDINLDPIETMSIFMPMVFFVIILIVIFLFMSLMVKQCRREIGILRALGFEKHKIRMLFCTINFIVSIGAIILGTCIGIGIMRYVGTYYANFFPIPFFEYSIELKMYLLAIILTIVVGQTATIVGASSIEKIAPSEAMSREAPMDAKVPKILELMTKNAKPFTKFSIISSLRNKIRFAFSVICISASVMMIFSSFSFITSKNYILNQLYNERIHYDAQIFFTEKPSNELIDELNSLDYVSDVQVVSYYDTEITANGKMEHVLVNSIPSESELIGIYDDKGNMISIPEDGIILERHIAESLGVKIGDTIEFNDVKFLIKEISEQSVNRIQYISDESSKDLGEGSLGSIILNIEDGKEQELIKVLSEKEEFLYTSFTKVSYESNEKTFATYDMAAWIIITFAIIIGLIIVVNTALTNLLEQKKKLCMLRVLGFKFGEISKNWFTQSFLQYVLACIIGLPAGIGIAKIALAKLSTSNREYVYANGIKEFLLTMILVLTYIVISHIITMHSMKKWDIVETVKEKE